MKTLKDYIHEASLLDIEGTIKTNDEAIKKSVEKWITDNFRVDNLKISDNPNSNGKYEVSAKEVIFKNKNITSLTNEYFVWKEVKKHFDCTYCKYLISLEGAPKEVGGSFHCSYCKSLKSLEGAPKKVGKNFNCSGCDNLISLEGAPKEVGKDFDCSGCDNLISLEGAPEKVDGCFSCPYCDKLISLEGAPKEVGKNFNCHNCKSLKSKDIPAMIKIKGKILK